MPVFATCGHEVFSGNDMIPVEYETEEVDFDTKRLVPVTIMATYCPACADEGVKGGYLRRTDN